MAKHKVRFEPVGIEIEVDEEETVLDAAFRQGISFFHGCREGQKRDTSFYVALAHTAI